MSWPEPEDFGRFVLLVRGRGKSAGARVIYIYRNDKFPVFLITVFAKNRKANLTKAERNALAKRAGQLFKT